MSEKNVLFMARTTRFHDFARTLTSTMGVEVYAWTKSPSGWTGAAAFPCC